MGMVIGSGIVRPPESGAMVHGGSSLLLANGVDYLLLANGIDRLTVVGPAEPPGFLLGNGNPLTDDSGNNLLAA
jgi:hypothetical protein